MPYAKSADTARIWATERAIKLFAIFAGDLLTADVKTLTAQAVGPRQDGARFAVIVPEGGQPTPDERLLADIFVESKPAPSPFGLFLALEAFDLPDTRELGVIGGSVETLDAGHRAGAGAIIGIAGIAISARRHLVLGQPDVIVAADELPILDRVLYASHRANRQRLVLSPDAAILTDKVLRAFNGPGISRFDPALAKLRDSVRNKLVQVAGVTPDWALGLMSGSTTVAIEALLNGEIRPGRNVLVCKNGQGGTAIEAVARRLGLGTAVVEAPILEPISSQDVAAALDANPDIDLVAVVHHETSTGLLNPVAAIAAEAKSRDVLVAIDARASLGAEELGLQGTGIDFVVSTSGLCLHGSPGIALMLISPRGQQRIGQVPPKSVSLDLRRHLLSSGAADAPLSPSIPALYAFEAALDELLDEGASFRRAFYQGRMESLDRALARLGLEPRVAAEHRSRSVRCLPLPPGMSYEMLHDLLKSRGYVVGPGIDDTHFVVGVFGAITIEALQGFTTMLERAISHFSTAEAARP